jgi:nitroreductase
MIIPAIEKRFSVRKLKERVVEQEKLIEILPAARLALSARNLQLWKLIKIKDKSIRD